MYIKQLFNKLYFAKLKTMLIKLSMLTLRSSSLKIGIPSAITITIYEVVQEGNNGIAFDSVELGTYLKTLFDSHYAEFLLNFGFDEIMQLLED